MWRLLISVPLVLTLVAPGAASAARPRSAGTGTGTTAVTGIGIKHSFGANSSGWGTVEPSHLYNGGDPSGDISRISWSSWGGAVAHGRGKNSIFSPKGGYYRRQAAIKLRAKDPGPCGSSGHIAYRHLFYSEPRKPGGRFGRWRIWTSYHRNLCKRFS